MEVVIYKPQPNHPNEKLFWVWANDNFEMVKLEPIAFRLGLKCGLDFVVYRSAIAFSTEEQLALFLLKCPA